MAFIQCSTNFGSVAVSRYPAGSQELVSLRVEGTGSSLCLTVAEAKKLVADLAALGIEAPAAEKAVA